MSLTGLSDPRLDGLAANDVGIDAEGACAKKYLLARTSNVKECMNANERIIR